jgi:hypothetical protein
VRRTLLERAVPTALVVMPDATGSKWATADDQEPVSVAPQASLIGVETPIPG